jgi:hypothetical protein
MNIEMGIEEIENRGKTHKKHIPEEKVTKN